MPEKTGSSEHTDRHRVTDILPPPFAWIDIPGGEVTLEGNKGSYIPEGKTETFTVAPFAIAKYPITNAQFRVFLDAGGYDNPEWWTAEGWQYRNEEGWMGWIEPRKWHREKSNHPDSPVVGASWYDAVAFCLWLNAEIAGSGRGGSRSAQKGKIMLPTEQQWQRAAQGGDGRIYPWGNEWDHTRCNNDWDERGAYRPTLVTRFEGADQSDSPFGVTDMVGNTHEWTLTDHRTGHQHVDQPAEDRIVRGGQWDDRYPEDFRVDCRSYFEVHVGGYGAGFRIAYV